MTDNILNNFYSLNFGDKSHSSFSRLSIRGLALACASLSALCTAPALAADASAPAAEDAPEIVVTAQKREESLQKVPISIGVLSGKTLDQQAVGGVADGFATGSLHVSGGVLGMVEVANRLRIVRRPGIIHRH